jgi:hypothetical protein
MSDAEAFATFDAYIAGLRKLGASFLDDAAREATPLVEAEIKRTAAAGTDPYGAPWRPRKDGSRAIPDAASVVTVAARGSTLRIYVSGGAAIQNHLAPEYRRQVIPDPYRPLPAGISRALHEGASRAFQKAMGA